VLANKKADVPIKHSDGRFLGRIKLNSSSPLSSRAISSCSVLFCWPTESKEHPGYDDVSLSSKSGRGAHFQFNNEEALIGEWLRWCI
jgi:hypothetical protein